MTSRRAFTLIELLLVMTVILILTALSIGHFGSALRKSAVQGAAEQIQRACDLARQLALQDGGRTDRYHGVRLEATSDGVTTVSVIEQTASGRTSLVYGSDNRPLYQYQLPGSAVVWEGDRDLGNGSSLLEWYFLPASGEVAEVVGGVIRHRYVGVGTRPITTGPMWGLATNVRTSEVIAPASATAPGLSVRSVDGSYRIAVGVYPSGLAYSTVYNDYRGGR